MNTILQNILVFISLGFALAYILRKFIWKPKKKTTKACGDNDCGCH